MDHLLREGQDRVRVELGVGVVVEVEVEVGVGVGGGDGSGGGGEGESWGWGVSWFGLGPDGRLSFHPYTIFTRFPRYPVLHYLYSHVFACIRIYIYIYIYIWYSHVFACIWHVFACIHGILPVRLVSQTDTCETGIA